MSFGIDVFLEEEDEAGNKRPMADDKILRFLLQYITIQLGMRLLSPKSFKKVYIVGVKKVFSDYNKSSEGLGRAFGAKVTKELMRGFERMHAKNHPEGESQKIPFTADLVTKALKLMFDKGFPGLQAIEILRIYTAMCVGVAFLLRCSEHIYSKNGTARPPYRGELIFRDYKGSILPYAQIGRVKTKSVTIYTTFSKADVLGKGRITTHFRQPDTAPFCVVRALEKWYQLTRDEWGTKETDPLYDLPRQELVPVSLSLKLLGEVMTRTTDIEKRSFRDESDEEEIKLVRVTSHSLRYGGATTMAAAGFPEHLIALYGGWVQGSKSLRVYINQLTTDTREEVSAAFARGAKIDAAQTYIDDHQVRNLRRRRRA